MTQVLTLRTHQLKTDASTESSVVLKTPPKPARASASYSLVEHITIVLSAGKAMGVTIVSTSIERGNFLSPIQLPLEFVNKIVIMKSQRC